MSTRSSDHDTTPDASRSDDPSRDPIVDLAEVREQRRPAAGARQRWEISLDDESAEPSPSIAPPVDPPDLPRPARWDSAARRRPIVPGWLRSRREFRTAVRSVAGYYGHTTGYHLTRTPKYAARLTLRAPRGAARLVAGLLRWATDTEGLPVRLAVVARADAEQYLKLSRQRDARVRARTIATTLGLAGLAPAGLLMLPAPSPARRAPLRAVG